MAAIDKRSNGRWRVRIRNRRAPALSKTFTRKADAMKWARDTEILIEQGHFTQTDNKLITLKDILERYRKERFDQVGSGMTIDHALEFFAKVLGRQGGIVKSVLRIFLTQVRRLL